MAVEHLPVKPIYNEIILFNCANGKIRKSIRSIHIIYGLYFGVGTKILENCLSAVNYLSESRNGEKSEPVRHRGQFTVMLASQDTVRHKATCMHKLTFHGRMQIRERK